MILLKYSEHKCKNHCSFNVDENGVVGSWSNDSHYGVAVSIDYLKLGQFERRKFEIWIAWSYLWFERDWNQHGLRDLWDFILMFIFCFLFNRNRIINQYFTCYVSRVLRCIRIAHILRNFYKLGKSKEKMQFTFYTMGFM